MRKEVAEKIKPIYERTAENVYRELTSLLPVIKKLDFEYPKQNDNLIMWVFANIAMIFALNQADKKQKERFGEYPPRDS